MRLSEDSSRSLRCPFDRRSSSEFRASLRSRSSLPPLLLMPFLRFRTLSSCTPVGIVCSANGEPWLFRIASSIQRGLSRCCGAHPVPTPTARARCRRRRRRRLHRRRSLASPSIGRVRRRPPARLCPRERQDPAGVTTCPRRARRTTPPAPRCCFGVGDGVGDLLADRAVRRRGGASRRYRFEPDTKSERSL